MTTKREELPLRISRQQALYEITRIRIHPPLPALERLISQHHNFAQGWAAWALTHADLWVRGLQEAFDSMEYHTEEAWEIAQHHESDATLAPPPHTTWYTFDLLTQVETPILPNTWSVFDP